MDRSSYGFYSKSSETLDNNQKNTQEDNKNLIKTQYPVIKTEKGVNPANTHQVQHVPAQQLLTNQNKTQTHDQDKNLNVKNSTTITLIENGHGDVNGDKDKKYITLEPKTEINDDNKNTITITPSLPKQQVVNNNSIDRKKETKLVKRPLQCLETLAEKAGITFEDKYEAANTLLALEKQNNFKKHTEQNQHKIGANGLEEIDTKYSQIHRHIKQQQELHEQLLKIHQLHQEHLVAQQQILQRQQQQFQKDAVNLQQQGQQQQFQQQQQQHQQQQQQQLQDSALRHQQRSEQPVLQQQLSSQQQQVQQQQLPQQQVHLQHRPPEKVSQVEATLHTAEHKYTPVSISQHQNTQLFNLPGIGEVNLSYIQHNVGLSFDKGLKNMSQDIKPQQIVEGQQGQVVHTGMSMSQQHDNQQHHQTVTVVSSMPNNMHQVQQQQQQQQQAVSNMQQQQQNNGITTMPPIQSLQPNSQHQQQLSTEWGHGRVQVIQQPLQNNAYLQQLYNAQGPLLMPGNLALHPSINSQQIQVIAAGKPFQGNQLAPHMITTQGKQVLQGQPVGTNPFPGYTTIPANPTTQNPTFVFSPLGVISSQPNILPSHSQSTVTISQQQKNNEMHKVLSSGKVAHKLSSGQQVPVGAQCVQVSQQPAQAQIISPLPTGGQTMQFAPWQISGAIPQVWTGGLQAGTLQGGGLLAPNPIFIRGTQPDAQTSMFIQHSPQNIQQNNTNVGCATGVSKPRPSADMSKSRPLSNILPSSGIRPASSVSTQTTANQAQSQAKQRGKPSVRSPAPATKQDAANQTNKMQHQMQQPKQQLVVMNSNGQMTQITSIQDKQALAKNVQQQQQQAIFQQQLMQQQQQQMLQQQSQQQQIVQQYQQGMALNMQQGTMPVGSVAQNISMATGMPQTISMVQHIHPLSGMTQQGTLVGQITNSNNQSQQPTMAQIQSMQQHQQHQQQQHQHQQTLLQGGMVQTSVGMSTQQPIMTHTTSMQTTLQTTLDDSSIIPTSLLQVPTVIQEQVQSTTMGQGQIGVQHGMITTPMMPLVHVKSEEDKQSQSQTQQTAPIVQQIAPQPAIVSSAPQTSMPPPAAPTTSVSHVANSEPAVSTTVEPPKPSLLVPKPEVSVATQQAAVNALATSAASTIVPASTSVQTSIVTSQVVTTTAALSQPSVTSLMSTTVSTNGLFKSPSCTPKHFPQSSMQDKTLPKAMVKPNILTHVIEGYVIQEAAEPFAVNRPIREWDKDDKENKLPSADEPPRKKQHIDSPSPRNESPTTTTPTKSENENSTADAAAKIPNACKWTVSEVCDFIRNIPGCAAYADEFFMQEVDGEALLLIRPQHLVMALNMKLGPALKIVACIDALRPENEQQSQNNVD